MQLNCTNCLNYNFFIVLNLLKFICLYFLACEYCEKQLFIIISIFIHDKK
jgi:hypothetical protein